ncbi:amidohydrolase family protein [Borrelia hermsii]|uniref:amidohydrolase family protein n=1 Tax=Borrelia hermsii TaxID=140 RepID=UPI001F528F80|nr:amidohydrolase family protein [Borrelia hermsii]
MKIACINPIMHYKIPVGWLRIGNPADFISITKNIKTFKIDKTYINGKLIFSDDKSYIPLLNENPINNFNYRKNPL